MLKIIIYILATVLVILSMNSLDINKIFKSTKPFEAKLFYFFIAISLIYLLTSFCYDMISISQNL